MFSADLFNFYFVAHLLCLMHVLNVFIVLRQLEDPGLLVLGLDLESFLVDVHVQEDSEESDEACPGSLDALNPREVKLVYSCRVGV
jgi:hypothetical protein